MNASQQQNVNIGSKRNAHWTNASRRQDVNIGAKVHFPADLKAPALELEKNARASPGAQVLTRAAHAAASTTIREFAKNLQKLSAHAAANTTGYEFANDPQKQSAHAAANTMSYEFVDDRMTKALPHHIPDQPLVRHDHRMEPGTRDHNFRTR